MNLLEQFGWKENWDVKWNELTAVTERTNSIPGRVLLEHKHSYRVMTEQGEWLATPSGKFQHVAMERRDYPAVGDWVAIAQMPGEEKGVIHSILPRTSIFSRKVAGDVTMEQIVAVNVDIVFLVMSLNKDFNIRRLERYLIAAWDSGANPVIVFTKKDLCEDVVPFIEETETVAFGVPIYTVSSFTGDGIIELQELLRGGKTAALLGSSGVGKSSLINALCGKEMMVVQEIRDADDKGRHTTTHRELVKMPGGGLLIDTPGMREFQLWDQSESLDSSFKDIEEIAERCRFRDCQHNKELGCAVKEALTTGELSNDRFNSYLKLKKELAYMERKTDLAAQKAERNKWKQLSKDIKKRPMKKR